MMLKLFLLFGLFAAVGIFALIILALVGLYFVFKGINDGKRRVREYRAQIEVYPAGMLRQSGRTVRSRIIK